jgi:hypothetical protein
MTATVAAPIISLILAPTYAPIIAITSVATAVGLVLAAEKVCPIRGGYSDKAMWNGITNKFSELVSGNQREMSLPGQ